MGELPADTPLARRSNALFMGTHVVSGCGRALVVRTGNATQFGAIAQRLRIRPDETDFERGVRAFGNLLIRMAGVSLLLPFLPLLPKQILLTNLLTDLPEMAIATDRVDAAALDKPRYWDVRFIRDFMLHFGLLSSLFDFLTFGVLYFMLRASPELFRSGWFVESVVSVSIIVLVIRTRRPFWRSRPSRALALATALVVVATVALPWTPLGRLFGFVPLPPLFLAMMGAIVLLYVASAEALKRMFYRRHGHRLHSRHARAGQRALPGLRGE